MYESNLWDHLFFANQPDSDPQYSHYRSLKKECILAVGRRHNQTQQMISHHGPDTQYSVPVGFLKKSYYFQYSTGIRTK